MIVAVVCVWLDQTQTDDNDVVAILIYILLD